MYSILHLKHFFGNLGYDGWVLGLTSLVAIIIGLLDFTPFINLSTDAMLRILIVASGLLMGTAVAQSARRKFEIIELRESLGLMDIEVLDGKKTFPQHLAEGIHRAKNFVLDTNLNEETRIGLEDDQIFYRQILDERLKKRDLSFRRVEVIFTRERLETVIRRLLMHEGQEYYIGHYYAPQKAIPVLHIMSFDGEGFYLGGFYSAGTAGVPAQERMVYIRQPEINDYLRDYWEILWRGAIMLNPNGKINWKELEQIALHINISAFEFQEMVKQITNEVQRSNAKRKREVKT
jgi:hypothetical protein